MLVPVLPHPCVLPVHTPPNDKPAQHLYYQQHTLQIIQLVEGQPPPPRRIGSIAPSDSFASSSSCSDYDSESESESDEESIQSSYCSSDDRPMHQPWSEHPTPYPVPIPDDTYSYRMKRVFDWRDHSSSDSDTSSSASSSYDLSRSSAPIRRLVGDAMDDDAMSHTSRHSRRPIHKRPSLPAYSCPACDASFPSRQSLKQHGLSAQVEACHAAVEYAFE